MDRYEAHIAHYLEVLTNQDKQDVADEDVIAICQKLAWMKKCMAELEDIQKKIEAHPDKQISTTAPDARLMNAKTCLLLWFK